MADLLDKIELTISRLEADLEEARKLRAEQTGELDRVGVSVPEILARMRDAGHRLPTGIPTVDVKTNGGIPRGKMVTIVGKPGAGKTSIATQCALHMARGRDAAILAVYHDSGVEDACLTIAQQVGATREEAQRGEAADVVADGLAQTQIALVDVNDRYALEDVYQRFCGGLQPSTVPILVIDSAQVVRSREGDRQKTQFDRVRVVADIVRSLTNRHRAVSFLVSQANRMAYRNKQDAQANDPMTAGAGSGNLEFMPDLYLFVESTDGQIRLHCRKNRLGEDQEWTIALRNDKPRHRHLEVDTLAEEAVVDEKRERAISTAEEKIVGALRLNSRLSGRALREATNLKTQTFQEALHRLADKRAITYEQGPRGALLWLLLS